MKLFQDTNIFLYAAGQEHAYRQSCRHIPGASAAGSLAATMAHYDMQQIVTADRDFDRFAWIDRIDPLTWRQRLHPPTGGPA